MNLQKRSEEARKRAERRTILAQTAWRMNGFLTMAEAQAIMRCGKTKLYNQLKDPPEGFPRLYRNGGTNLFKREDVDAWMNSGGWR